MRVVTCKCYIHLFYPVAVVQSTLFEFKTMNHRDFVREFQCLTPQSRSKSSSYHDLHLAAELGKTLLDKNKELEETMKHQNNNIEELKEELKCLQKQNEALQKDNQKNTEQLESILYESKESEELLIREQKSLKNTIKTLQALRDLDKAKLNEMQFLLENVKNRVVKVRKEIGQKPEEENKGKRHKTAESEANEEDIIFEQLKGLVRDIELFKDRFVGEIAELKEEKEYLIHDKSLLECKLLKLQELAEETRATTPVCLMNHEPVGLLVEQKQTNLSDYEKHLEALQAQAEEAVVEERVEDMDMFEPETSTEMRNISLADELKMCGVWQDSSSKYCECEEDRKTALSLTHKSTQTNYQQYINHKTFLCTFTIDESIDFNVYDHQELIDDNSRRFPEYRELFRDIFSSLMVFVRARDSLVGLSNIQPDSTTKKRGKKPYDRNFVSKQTVYVPSYIKSPVASVTSHVKSPVTSYIQSPVAPVTNFSSPTELMVRKLGKSYAEVLLTRPSNILNRLTRSAKK